MLKNRINGVPDKSRLILEVFQNHNEKMAKLVGSDFALGTLGQYQTTFDHTKAFIEWKYKASDLSIQELDFDFISEFEYAYQYVEDTGLLSGVPQALERYFDYEAFAKDLFLEGYSEYEGHIFTDY